MTKAVVLTLTVLRSDRGTRMQHHRRQSQHQKTRVKQRSTDLLYYNLDSH